MPTGDLPGWRQVFTDDFPGAGVDKRKWGLYSGQPAGDPGGWWDPSHVEAGGGVARLRTYRDPRFGDRWVSGGMSSARGLTQLYGKYDVRFRMDAGYGIASIVLLWPTADHWPPEIDFAENGGRTTVRDRMSATLHYGEDDRIVQETVYGDFTRWHTMGVEWTPGRLVYTLDGRPWERCGTRPFPPSRWSSTRRRRPAPRATSGTPPRTSQRRPRSTWRSTGSSPTPWRADAAQASRKRNTRLTT